MQKAKALAIEGLHINFIRQGYNTMNCSSDKENIDFNQLKRQIHSCILQLVRQLLPSGKLANSEYVALNPTRCDKNLGSFRINIFTGKWADFATGDKGGDLISLWAYVKGVRQIDAARELQAIVGGV